MNHSGDQAAQTVKFARLKDFVGCLTEQFVEFHHCFLQLAAICGNIAQSTFGVAISGIDNQRLTLEI